MSRYIDAEKLKCSIDSETDSIFDRDKTTEELYYNLCELVDDEPTTDVQEVKHGEWFKPSNDPVDSKQWICSECKGLTETAYYCGHCYYNYCPNCGARLTAEQKMEEFEE